MVLESISNPWQAERRPVMLLLWGIIYGLIGGLLANWLFPSSMASIVMVALAAIAAIPLMFNTIKNEEEKELEIASEKKRLVEHSKAILVLMLLFSGMTIGMTLLYVVLPSEQAVKLFADQATAYQAINSPGIILSHVTGFATSGSSFTTILFNNLKVLLFCAVFSLLYGAGSMVVLSWNASLMALAMGNIIRTNLAILAGKTTIGEYFNIIAVQGFGRYFIHGFFEITAYVIAALAGGIISVAIIKHNFDRHKAERIILDTSDLLLASFAVLIFAAAVEAWIVPALFA